MSSAKSVNKARIQDYEEHLANPQIFELKATAASLITLSEEYRSSIESRNTTKVRKFIEKVMNGLEEWWGFDKQEEQNIKEILLSTYMECFGFSSCLTPQDASAMLKIADTLSKVCERAHKINDDMIYKLDWGEKMVERLTMFLEQVIFPEIPPQARINIAMKAKSFFSSTKKQAQLPAESVIDMGYVK